MFAATVFDSAGRVATDDLGRALAVTFPTLRAARTWADTMLKPNASYQRAILMKRGEIISSRERDSDGKLKVWKATPKPPKPKEVIDPFPPDDA